MSRPVRIILILAAVAAFIAISLGVGRVLSAQGAQRNALQGLIAKEASGNALASARLIDNCSPGTACFTHMTKVVGAVGHPGERLELLQIDQGSGFSPGAQTKVARLAWHTGSRLPTVQCAVVETRGSVISGFSIHLLAVSAPIARDGACPEVAKVLAAAGAARS
jgi:hypothetical protein